MVSICKGLQESIDMLGLLGELGFHEQLPDSHVHGVLEEAKPSHVATQNGLREGVCTLGDGRGYHAPADNLLKTGKILGRGIVLSPFGEYHRLTCNLQ